VTQDQGPGYVVRGEVIADDDTGEFPAEQAGPMTRFERVAAAPRDDRPEPPAPDAAGHGSADAPSDEVGSDEVGTDEVGTDEVGTDEVGTDEVGTDEVGADEVGADEVGADEVGADEVGADEVGADEVGADEVGAVRSPDAGDLDDWDDAEDGTGPAQEGLAKEEPAEEEPAENRDQADSATGPHEATAPSATVPSAPAEPELRPGEADAGLRDVRDLTHGSLLPDASEFRERWQQVQFRFVDDPHGSVTEAADVIAQVTARLEAAIAERQHALRGRWADGTNADTETLRATLLMYRAFLDQLTGTRTS
jgi:hypothetical protein